MYGSWDMEQDRQNFFSLRTFFLFIYPLTTQKIRILKNEKNAWRYHHLHKFTINNNHMMHGSWDMCVILGYFLLFYPANNPKNQNFGKMKKKPGDIIILHKCTKHHDHMLYCSWYMARDECNCHFSFWPIFYPFTPLTARKIKI